MKKISTLLLTLSLASTVLAQSSGFKGTVLETMDAGGYTYAEIDTGKAKLWIAGPKTAVKKGETINTPIGFEMKDFKSPSLNRTFASIFFVGGIKQGEGNVDQALPPGHPPLAGNKDMKDTHPGVAEAIEAHNTGKAIPTAVVDFKGIAKVDGGYTVDELLKAAKGLDTKTVRFRARVVKANKGIMGRNWFHFQDGTGDKADITVTSKEVVALGDTVLVEGEVALDQDFGLGYKYPVLVENAKLAVEK